MKKYLYLLSVPAMMTLNSCLQEDIVKGNGKEVTAKVTLNLPGEGVQSRAGDPKNPSLEGMRLYLSVYEGDELVKTYVEETNLNLGNGYSTNIRLVSGKTYQIVAWADHGSDYYAYDAENKTVKLTDLNVAASETLNDAYFITEPVTLEGNEPINLTLKRPFGLIKVTTEDWDEAAVKADAPELYNTQMTVPTQLNLLDGTVGENATVAFSGKIAEEAATTDGKKVLSFDYVFAGTEQSALTDFTVNYTGENNEAICSYDFKNIPARRNYITNITGNVLTKQGNVTVSILPDWETGDINVDLIEVGSTDEIEAYLESISEGTIEAPKELNFAVTAEVTEDYERMSIPNIASDISISYREGFQAGKNLTISGDEYTGKLTLDVNNPKGTNPAITTISLPKGTVELKSGTYGDMSVTTSGNTFHVFEGITTDNIEVLGGSVRVDKGATVKSITLNSGAAGTVKIYGNVGSITDNSNGGYRCYLALGNNSDNGNDPAGALAKEWVNGGVILTEGTYAGNVSIVKEGFELTGEGNRDEIIVNGNIQVAADNVTVKGISVNSTAGDAIYTEKLDNITMNVDSVYVYKTGGATCVRVAEATGVTLNVKNSNLVITKNSMRGVNFYDLTEGSPCVLNLEGTHIGPKAETMGHGDYTGDQNAVFKGLTDTRGISFGAGPSGLEVNISNSVVEGVFYAVNVIPAAGPISVNMENSTLDGRCAFNLWGRNEAGENRFYVKNSRLVGRNPFGGPTEEFATIVFNFGAGSGFSEPKNNHVIVEDSEIYCYNNPETDTNSQYAADMRSWDVNTLELKGNTKIYDRSASSRLEYAVQIASSDNILNVDNTVMFLDRNGAPKTQPIVKAE